ncbi:hypothetical protein CROQUDRAFT_102024 [Cronartium quercuum f. sp. fusiforme G11]|uniref:Uncharacterized protein n=1 Tax=Cronartium quercuum f. sp. fusiforme G11 TaxID=708437 RepID=A0A9P6N888_9BASI|nr:hypothetical protein CROQUDRAFT_102024 [Cronartium quercuum f. sp. fusiforme G11]
MAEPARLGRRVSEGRTIERLRKLPSAICGRVLAGRSGVDSSSGAFGVPYLHWRLSKPSPKIHKSSTLTEAFHRTSPVCFRLVLTFVSITYTTTRSPSGANLFGSSRVDSSHESTEASDPAIFEGPFFKKIKSK